MMSAKNMVVHIFEGMVVYNNLFSYTTLSTF